MNIILSYKRGKILNALFLLYKYSIIVEKGEATTKTIVALKKHLR